MNVQQLVQSAAEHQRAGRLRDAEAGYRNALKFVPGHPRVLNALAITLAMQQRLDEAIEIWRQVTRAQPDNADALGNLGAALAQQKKLDEAEPILRRTLALRPQSPNAYNNLANALDGLGKTEEALALWDRAIQLDANYFDALFNSGRALQTIGRGAQAFDRLDRAIRLRPLPASAEAYFLRGLGYLRDGQILEGFADYEYRLLSADLKQFRRSFPQPRWDGGDLSGKTILIHAEQGLGDSIQFVRYAGILAQRGGRVIVECQASLRSVIVTAPGVSAVIEQGAPLPPFDAHAPMPSLPMICRTTLDSIPWPGPYVSADRSRVEWWRTRLNRTAPVRHVGLVWAGNPKHTNDRNRSMPVAALDRLPARDDLIYHSLQVGAAAGEVGAFASLKPVDESPLLHDFGETAALVANLDLVISVDTSTVHLAGAMGKPVWTLLPFVPDWRWMTGRSDSPWYPTMKLFRQPAPRAWAEVIDQVGQELVELPSA